jgi:hypothetical protein
VIHHLTDFSRILANFSKSHDESIALIAISLTRRFVTFIGQIYNLKETNLTLIEEEFPESLEESKFNMALLEGVQIPQYGSTHEMIMTLIEPIMFSLSSLVNTKNIKVLKKGLDALFLVMLRMGSNFSKESWATIYHNTITPLVNEMESFFLSSSSDLSTTHAKQLITRHSFQSIVKVFSAFCSEMSEVFSLFIDRMALIIKARTQYLTDISLLTLGQMVNSFGDKIKPEQWELMVGLLSQLYEESYPFELLHYKVKDVDLEGNQGELLSDESMRQLRTGIPLEFDLNEQYSKCLMMFRVIEFIKFTFKSAYSVLDKKVSPHLTFFANFQFA